MENNLRIELESVFDEMDEDKEIFMDLLMESLTSNDEKAEKLGKLFTMLLSANECTPFEACAIAGCIIMSAADLRARAKGVESTKIFVEHMVDTIKQGCDEVLKEAENDSGKDDCCGGKC